MKRWSELDNLAIFLLLFGILSIVVNLLVLVFAAAMHANARVVAYRRQVEAAKVETSAPEYSLLHPVTDNPKESLLRTAASAHIEITTLLRPEENVHVESDDARSLSHEN